MATQALERPVETPTPGQIIAKYQSQAPVDVVAIAAELGINVWETNSLSESISGKIFKDPLNGGSSGYSILVNAGHSLARKRFTIAHEIAHFILHRKRLESGDLVDDAMYRSGVSAREETEANMFAADLLMPFPLDPVPHGRRNSHARTTRRETASFAPRHQNPAGPARRITLSHQSTFARRATPAVTRRAARRRGSSTRAAVPVSREPNMVRAWCARDKPARDFLWGLAAPNAMV